MKKLFYSAAILSLFFIGLASSGEDTPVPTPDTPPTIDTKGIIEMTEGVGDWTTGYVTPVGYFFYDNNVGEAEGTNYQSLSYMTADEKDFACLIANTTDMLPTQLLTSRGNLYFSFPNDSILELLYDDGTRMEMVDSIPYIKANLPGLQEALKNDVLKAALANAALLLKANKGVISNANLAEIIKSLADVFDQVCALPYVKGDETLSKYHKDPDGNFDFANVVREWFDKNVTVAYKNVLSLWTGNASYKVGGSSCTLAASVFCSSATYNEYGVYGILCDANPDNLKTGVAEYEGTGYQGAEDVSYSVDFRGFKPNTTYYYTAFYKFNSGDHGDLIAKYGNPNADVIYDTTVKSFTTGDNRLSVDVVMCIDVTGSMSDIIRTVKNNAIQFYDIFKEECDAEGIELGSLNAQVIDFRDKNVDASWLNTSRTYTLPAERDNYNDWVNSLYADGGGDTPESGLEALDAAFDKTDWGVDDGYHRQVVILWTDAPYLIGEEFTALTVEDLEAKWNKLPSGRRLILFAPNGTDYNGGSWSNLDGWKNLIHETNLYSGFNDFRYILRAIIGELTSKGAPARKAAPAAPAKFKSNY